VLREFIFNRDLTKMPPSDFQYRLNNLMCEIFAEWEAKALAEEIPQVVVEKFVLEVQDIRSALLSFIQSLNTSYFSYENNRLKFKALLDMLCGFEELVAIRFETSLDQMNGEISQSVYKGLKCLDCVHCQSVKAPYHESKIKHAGETDDGRSNDERQDCL